MLTCTSALRAVAGKSTEISGASSANVPGWATCMIALRQNHYERINPVHGVHAGAVAPGGQDVPAERQITPVHGGDLIGGGI